MHHTHHRSPRSVGMPTVGLVTMAIMAGFPVAQAQDPSAPVSAPPVVVTATRSAQSVTDAPGAISVIPRAEIERLNVFTLDQAVGALPGLFARRSKSFMDTQGSIQLRGIPDENRTLILVDGLPMNDGYTGGVRLGSLSLADVSQVEVLRGPGSSLYGGNAMGGVVQVLTRMPDGPLAEVRAGYGSSLSSDFGLENLRSTTVRLGNRYESGLSILATIARRTTDGYRSDLVTSTATPPGTITGAEPSITSSGTATRVMGERGTNSWEDYDAGLSLRYELNAAHAFQLRLRRVYYQYGYGEPLTYLRNAVGDPVFNFTNGASVLRQSSFVAGGGLNERDIVQGVYEGRFAGGDVRLQFGYIDSGRNRFATADSTLATLSGGAGRITNTPNTTELVDGQWTRGITAAHTITLGASLRRDSAHVYDFAMPDWRNLDVTSGSMLSESRGKSFTTSVFGQDQWAVTSDLTAYLGLRWDRWDATDGYAQDLNPSTLVPRPGFPRTFADRSDSALSPKAGLVWQADARTTVRTSVGTAFRAPAMFDMHRTFVSTAGTIFLANPELSPETIRSFDAGVEHRPWDGGRVAVNVFHNDLRDLLYRRTVTVLSEAQALCGTSATITNCRQLVNAGRARSRGIEFELAHASGPWHWFANAMYVDSRVLENAFAPASVGRRLVGVPQIVANAGGTYSTGRLSVTTVARYAGKVHRDDSNSDRFNGIYGSQDPRTLVDLKMAWRFHRHASASLAIDNLFDRQYYDFYRGVGRTAFAELTLNY
jgi:iron complex outermembrane receptor protein